MYYTIYQITNLINYKIYIGCHKTNNLGDGYMGSGKILKRAIEKYGINNFQKEILGVFEIKEEMFHMESVLVNEEFVKRTDTYNLKIGGEGGFDYLNNTRLNLYGNNGNNGYGGENLVYGDKMIQILKQKRTYDKFCKKISESKKGNTNWLGKKHSDESKRKIGEANSKHQKGEKNSQYGTCWIYHPESKQNKKIDNTLLDVYTQQGWIKGRKIKQ